MTRHNSTIDIASDRNIQSLRQGFITERRNRQPFPLLQRTAIWHACMLTFSCTELKAQSAYEACDNPLCTVGIMSVNLGQR